MNEPGTRQTGPLGSTIHVLRADADTIVELAALDWNRQFRRVCLDPVRGLITLISPSRLHEDLASIFDDIVGVAASELAGAARKLRGPRLRAQGEPPGTGMEPDCAFYVGKRARAYREALREGEAAADAYLESIAPDLVVEAEITSADAGKAARYGEMGVRELWRLHGRKGTRDLRVEFFSLSTDRAPRALDASEVLDGLTPGDVCDAVEGVRFSLSDQESREAVARVVRRRQRASVRVREEEGAYSQNPREPAAPGDSRQAPGRTETAASHG